MEKISFTFFLESSVTVKFLTNLYVWSPDRDIDSFLMISSWLRAVIGEMTENPYESRCFLIVLKMINFCVSTPSDFQSAVINFCTVAKLKLKWKKIKLNIIPTSMIHKKLQS